MKTFQHRKIFLSWALVALPSFLWADYSVQWNNFFTFYGDNTEFYEPYRLRETILGQYGKSWFDADLGVHDTLSAGVYANYRSILTPDLTVAPVLSFDYHDKGMELIMGTLHTVDRHGLLEPLEVTTLELTRPIEYGLQWIEKDPGFHADVFLDWQLLNTPGVPETLDYGGVVQLDPKDPLSLELQYHGYHEGGKLYYVTVYNNYVPAVGLRFKTPLGSFAQLGLAGFAVFSGTMSGGWNLDAVNWGYGGYFRPSLDFGEGWELSGIYWRAYNFLSQEGDYNYNSYSQYQDYYQANRAYAEGCLRKAFPMEGGASFVSEVRLNVIDAFWDYSFRLMVYAPFNLPVIEGPKTGKKVEDEPAP
jgi:hypothetical protein